MLDAVKKVASFKILQRSKLIKKIKSERGEMFGKYFHNRTLAIISPKKNPGDHHHLMWNRSVYRRKHFRKIDLFNWRKTC